MNDKQIESAIDTIVTEGKSGDCEKCGNDVLYKMDGKYKCSKCGHMQKKRSMECTENTAPPIQNSHAMWKAIKSASDREYNDDHLTDPERQAIVTAWRRWGDVDYSVTGSADLTDEFINIID